MRYLSLLLFGLSTLLANAAGVKISDLALSTAPSTNTFLEIADLNATGTNKSAKVLYTNLFMRAGLWTNAAGVVSLNNLTANGTLKLTADDGAGQGVIDLWTAGTKRWTLSGGGILYPQSNYDLGTTVNPVQAGYFSSLGVQLADRKITSGTGSPEGVRTAEVSSLYLQTDGAAGTTLWTKATGSGNTGWEAIDSGTIGSAANWTAIGTTNSSLVGVATANAAVIAQQITFGVGSAVVTNLAQSGIIDNRTTNEVVIINNCVGNTLVLRNDNDTGFSAIVARGKDNAAYTAWGYGNTNTTEAPIFKDVIYWEGLGNSTTDQPRRMIIAQDGNYGSSGSGFRFYQRQSFETNGNVIFWGTDAPYPSQTAFLTFRGSDGFLFAGPTTAPMLTVSPTTTVLKIGNAVSSGTFGNELQGCDNNFAISLRAGNVSSFNNSFYSYGGTIANNAGHQFFTGGLRASQTVKLTIADDGVQLTVPLFVPKTITAAGTTGNQTINKMSGSVNFAAAAQSITVTDSAVTANSVIMATVATDDTTAKSCIAVPGAGSFVLKLNAAATAETRVQFLVTN